MIPHVTCNVKADLALGLWVGPIPADTQEGKRWGQIHRLAPPLFLEGRGGVNCIGARARLFTGALAASVKNLKLKRNIALAWGRRFLKAP